MKGSNHGGAAVGWARETTLAAAAGAHPITGNLGFPEATQNGVPAEATIFGLREEKKRITVLLADDHPIVRDGLRRLLGLETDIEVIGEAGDGKATLEMVRDLSPDILLLDLRMPDMDGLATLQVLRQLQGKTRTILLTASENKEDFVQAMRFGCSGIVLKQASAELIAKSIRKVNEGEIWLDSNTTAAVMREFSSSNRQPQTQTGNGGGRMRDRSPLSTRERELVALVAQGYKNKEIAEKMFISEQTVKNHLHNIFDKLGISDRLELALYAIHNGLHVLEGR
jgi:DNA-binding NarL/FixJ family response regulator